MQASKIAMGETDDLIPLNFPSPGNSAADSEFSPGTVLGGSYRLTKRLARGGMGDIHLATHERLPGQLVVKVLNPDLVKDQDAFMRFCQEAVAMANIRHPNVVQLVDFNFTLSGFPYLVMEYLPGRDLSEILCARDPFSPSEVARVVHQIACALDAAHKHGVVHRDLKPENIMVVPCEGQDDLIKVIDFGISKARRFNHVTAASMVMGTPEFMSPEQAEGRQADIDAPSDQFALAVISYLLLSGRTPWGTSAPTEILHRVVNKSPLPLRNDGDWPSVEAVLFRGMAKNPGQRYASTLAFWRALERAMMNDGLLRSEPNQSELHLFETEISPEPSAAQPTRADRVDQVDQIGGTSQFAIGEQRAPSPSITSSSLDSWFTGGFSRANGPSLPGDSPAEGDHDQRLTVAHRRVRRHRRYPRVLELAVLAALILGGGAGLMKIPTVRVRAAASWQSIRNLTSRATERAISDAQRFMSKIPEEQNSQPSAESLTK